MLATPLNLLGGGLAPPPPLKLLGGGPPTPLPTSMFDMEMQSTSKTLNSRGQDQRPHGLNILKSFLSETNKLMTITLIQTCS